MLYHEISSSHRYRDYEVTEQLPIIICRQKLVTRNFTAGLVLQDVFLKSSTSIIQNIRTRQLNRRQVVDTFRHLVEERVLHNDPGVVVHEVVTLEVEATGTVGIHIRPEEVKSPVVISNLTCTSIQIILMKSVVC